jgi:hypothetical protein
MTVLHSLILHAGMSPFVLWLPPHSPPQYLGPQTVLPLASFLAAIIGILLIFWRYLVRSVRRAIRALRRPNQENADSSPAAHDDTQP